MHVIEKKKYLNLYKLEPNFVFYKSYKNSARFHFTLDFPRMQLQYKLKKFCVLFYSELSKDVHYFGKFCDLEKHHLCVVFGLSVLATFLLIWLYAWK